MMQLSMQLSAATIDGIQLNSELSKWRFMIGSRKRLHGKFNSVLWL